MLKTWLIFVSDAFLQFLKHLVAANTIARYLLTSHNVNSQIFTTAKIIHVFKYYSLLLVKCNCVVFWFLQFFVYLSDIFFVLLTLYPPFFFNFIIIFQATFAIIGRWNLSSLSRRHELIMRDIYKWLVNPIGETHNI